MKAEFCPGAQQQTKIPGERCSKGQSQPLTGAAWWSCTCPCLQHCSWTRWLLRVPQTVLWLRVLHSCNLCCSSPCWVVDANTALLNRWAVRAWLCGVCSACSSQRKCTHVSRGSGRAGAAHKFTAVLCAALHHDKACSLVYGIFWHLLSNEKAIIPLRGKSPCAFL